MIIHVTNICAPEQAMMTLGFVAHDLKGSDGFFCRGTLRLSSIIFNSPFEYDVF